MAEKSIFSKFYLWLISPDVFGSAAKKIPGKWELYEYYRDTDEQLLHVQEADLNTRKEALLIEFSPDEEFSIQPKLSVALFQEDRKGSWSVHRNFITLIDASDFRNNTEFQFAFEKEDLKLLKKDKAGKIEFFGFFKQQGAAAKS